VAKKLIRMAIAYDFDGTLASGNIQENSFIPTIGMKKAEFWRQNKQRAEKHEADETLSYMTFMLERAQAQEVPVRRKDFAAHGKTVPYGGVMEVMNLLRTAGYLKVALVGLSP
jgi:biopolymer transport protein ExbD